MSIRDRLITLGNQARSVVRDVPTLLRSVVRPGDRVAAPNHAPDMMAPWPQVDRYPIRLGSRVTFDYIGAAQRIALTGYRQQWVDLLQELRNRDPSAFANLEARIFATAGGRVHVVSASAAFKADDIGQAQRARVEAIRQAAGLAPSLPELTEDERLLADQIATHVQRQIDALPRKPQVMAQQLWAIYYGVAGNELLWERRTNEWALRELHYVHPRRWAYPDQNNWHPHVWDQGFISPTEIDGKTTQPFGVDVCDYPGKFLVHVPEILSGYPTEDGLGFVIAWWIAAKIMGARSFMQYIEKYSKPGTVARYNTKNDTGQPRNATPEDIDLAVQVVQQMGFGGLPGVAIPDSIELDLFGPGAKGSKGGTADPQTFATWCDDQIARAIRTTDGLQGLQKNGARAAMETLLKGADRVAFYDAIGLAATWTRDTSCPITRLNYPTFERLAPTIVIHVESEPGPDVILERAAKAVAIGMPLDADKVAAKTGMTDMLADRNDPNVRVLYPVKALEILPPANQSPAPEVGEPKKPEPTDEEDQEV